MTTLPKPAYVLSEPHLSGYRVVLGYETMTEAQDAQKVLSTHPASTDSPAEGGRSQFGPTEDAPRRHVPEAEPFAVNPRPKTNEWRDLKLFRYDGTDLFQWFGRRRDSVFYDAGSDPFLMRTRPAPGVREKVAQAIFDAVGPDGGPANWLLGQSYEAADAVIALLSSNTEEG